MKSNSHMKKERPPSEKSMLLEADPLEKKTGRKISMVTNKSEPGSAKGRKVPGHPKSGIHIMNFTKRVTIVKFS